MGKNPLSPSHQTTKVKNFSLYWTTKWHFARFATLYPQMKLFSVDEQALGCGRGKCRHTGSRSRNFWFFWSVSKKIVLPRIFWLPQPFGSQLVAWMQASYTNAALTLATEPTTTILRPTSPPATKAIRANGSIEGQKNFVKKASACYWATFASIDRWAKKELSNFLCQKQ